MDDHAACNESTAYNESYVRTLWKIQAGYYEVVTFSSGTISPKQWLVSLCSASEGRWLVSAQAHEI